ncbi:GTP cyclohydrolase [Apibacter raozihei]|uniref:GTP cyclohydrolase n=1 Tax=Apibacter raozihei TaxID=2500547 RepID=UPI000FE3AE64|nr:GTP cyclohydrolase [Apibacter raozihei]
MEIEVKEIASSSGLKNFVKFPLSLYKGNKFYVPSLIQEELECLDKNKNPVFEHAEVFYFLAYKDKKVVGRIAAIINNQEIEKQKKLKIRFGWFDVIDDIEVTKKLIHKVIEIGKKKRLEYIEGPVGFSNLDKAGLLTEGFEKKSTMIALYNYRYYESHLKALGFTTANEWVENYLTLPEELPEKVTKFADIIQKRYDLKSFTFRNKQEMEPFIYPIFDLLEKTYGSLDSYVPITKNEISFYKKKYLKILIPEFVNCVTDKNGKLCAFAVTSPSFADALQKSGGKLFPWGWYHLYTAVKKTNTAESLLIGVHPNYQKKGITSLVFRNIFQTYKKYGLRYMETNPQLIDNLNVQLLWKEFNPVVHKKRKTFKKLI